MNSKIKDLLNLQNYDVERLKLEAQLAGVPGEVASLEGKIGEIRAKQKAGQDRLKEMEVERKDVDNQLRGAEDKIVTLKTKQLSVKKNEEYEALNLEIRHQEELVGDLETKELELMEELDEVGKELKGREAGDAERIGELEGQIGHLRKKEGELKTRIDALRESTDEAAKLVDRVFLEKYEQIKRQVKRGPYVVPLKEGRCEGCHLTVSNDVVSGVRHMDGPQQCNSCSRILYMEG